MKKTQHVEKGSGWPRGVEAGGGAGAGRRGYSVQGTQVPGHGDGSSSGSFPVHPGAGHPRGAVHLWKGPAAPRCHHGNALARQTHGNTHLHMETPCSWQRACCRQHPHDAALTAGDPRTGAPQCVGPRQDAPVGMEGPRWSNAPCASRHAPMCGCQRWPGVIPGAWR